jgi:integrase
LDRDLAFVGIAKRDELGRTFDLHAFRTSLCTHLARAGVPLRTAQAVMRHSDPSLTANIYTDPTLLDTAAAIASLPALGVAVASTKSGSA